MRPVNDLVSIEELDRNILSLCTRINAATYELLVMIRAFDERLGWAKWGLESCAEWLAWRCDFSMATAREKVRVAHALTDLPLVSASFSTGEMSYSKVRSLTRVATMANEDELVDSSWRRRQADAFVTMVKEYLGGEISQSGSDNYLVTIHVDQSALAGEPGRASVPIESVKRLCCDSKAAVLTEDDTGQPLSIGRQTRIVPSALQRAIRARDNDTCTFPGCKNHRFLHCHHVEHWSNGGETNLENLMSLCTKHHTLVHEGGFRIEKDYADRWYFMRPDGIAVPECGYVSRPYENPLRGGYLSVAEKSVSEPPPPVYLH